MAREPLIARYARARSMKGIDLPAWTAADRAELDPIEARWSVRAKIRLTADRLLGQWVGLVKSVERGYQGCVDDYRNDLDARMLLDEAIREIAPATAARITGFLASWDERFRAATRIAQPPVWSGGWWAQRVPLLLTGELAGDLRDETEPPSSPRP
jgi:hypothetical protein